jgi:hypothetical protein
MTPPLIPDTGLSGPVTPYIDKTRLSVSVLQAPGTSSSVRAHEAAWARMRRSGGSACTYQNERSSSRGERHDPDPLPDDVRADGPEATGARRRFAEEAAFDFAVISDHYSPWLETQGHSPDTWSVLGAAAQATRRTHTVRIHRSQCGGAMDQFRWFTGGWRVNAELPVPAS